MCLCLRNNNILMETRYIGILTNVFNQGLHIVQKLYLVLSVIVYFICLSPTLHLPYTTNVIIFIDSGSMFETESSNLVKHRSLSPVISRIQVSFYLGSSGLNYGINRLQAIPFNTRYHCKVLNY